MNKVAQNKAKVNTPVPGQDYITAEFNDFLVSKQIFDKTTTVYEVALLTFLYKYAFSSKGIFPGFSTMARNLHCGRRTVIRTLTHLVELGLITKTFRGKENSGEYKTNLYSLTLGGSATQTLPSATQTLPSAREAPKRGVGVSKPNKLYIEPIITNKLSERARLQKAAAQEQEFFYPKKQQQYQQSWEAPPLQKVEDSDIELIPLERLGGNFPKNIRTILPGMAKCPEDKPLNQALEALKSKSRRSK